MKRDEKIDIVKGLGIIFMVLRHSRAPYSDFVLLFHMAIFFIASGYLYNPACAKTVKSAMGYIKKKIKSLYLPYLGYTLAFILLNNFFLKINVYTDNPKFLDGAMVETTYAVLGEYYSLKTIIKQVVKALFFRAGTQLGGAFWFFQVLFMVQIGYTIVEFLVNKITANHTKQQLIQTAVSVALLLVGYWCFLTGHGLYGLNRVCSVYILIHIGTMLRDYSVTDRIWKVLGRWGTIIISFLTLLGGYQRGYIALDGNNIENPIFFLVMSLAGWFLLYSISDLMVEKRCFVNNGLSYISRHSVPIIALHFLCFKIVNALVVIVYDMNIWMIAAFPVLTVSGMWWLLYTIIGVGGPLLMRAGACKLKMYVAIGWRKC